MNQNRVEGNPQADQERRLLLELPRICLSSKELCDFELMAVGALPFLGFMTEEEYKSVINQMRLPNGDIFPVPIVLSVNENTANQADNNKHLVLTDREGIPCGILDVVSIWEPNKKEEAELVFGTNDRNHPGVAYLYDSPPYYIGGPIQFIKTPSHYRFQDLRLTPEQVIEWKKENNLYALVAFQTRNPIHGAYFEATLHALRQVASEYPITREVRETNILRVGLVAAEIARRGGIAIVSLMAPYRNPRDIIRKITSDIGAIFIEVHVATPIEVCKQRDPKHLYQKARRGLISHLSGVDEPYEEPENPEIKIDTTNINPQEAVIEILFYLEKSGLIS